MTWKYHGNVMEMSENIMFCLGIQSHFESDYVLLVFSCFSWMCAKDIETWRIWILPRQERSEHRKSNVFLLQNQRCFSKWHVFRLKCAVGARHEKIWVAHLPESSSEASKTLHVIGQIGASSSSFLLDRQTTQSQKVKIAPLPIQKKTDMLVLCRQLSRCKWWLWIAKESLRRLVCNSTPSSSFQTAAVRNVPLVSAAFAVLDTVFWDAPKTGEPCLGVPGEPAQMLEDRVAELRSAVYDLQVLRSTSPKKSHLGRALRNIPFRYPGLTLKLVERCVLTILFRLTPPIMLPRVWMRLIYVCIIDHMQFEICVAYHIQTMTVCPRHISSFFNMFYMSEMLCTVPEIQSMFQRFCARFTTLSSINVFSLQFGLMIVGSRL